MDNMEIYNRVRSVPEEATKQIQAGRLKGMTDINPMWRIKALTEAFGPCGQGWRYEIERLWLEPGADGEAAAFALIGLYVRVGDGWGAKIPGIGGSMLVANERAGLHTSDECYKMALTDALSVACKALGVAADVYWAKDTTKYSRAPQPSPALRCEVCGAGIKGIKTSDAQYTAQEVASRIKAKCGRVLCKACQATLGGQEAQHG